MLPEISHPILDNIEDFCKLYLDEKVPHIPAEAKAQIVRHLPIAVIIIIVAQLASILSYFQIVTLFTGLGYLYYVSPGIIGFVGILLLAVAALLEGVAVPLLFRHKIKGWRYVFYAVLVAGINDIINLNIVNLIFAGLVILYILFQVRDEYK